jgi:uncharacterized protein
MAGQGDFEWDDDKARTNLAKHGISFDQATRAFDDKFAVEYEDDRANYGEERRIRLAMVDQEILSVVYTERPPRNRIISARAATRDERDQYFVRNAHGYQDDDD